jgi:hypothetical protein
MSDDFVGVLMDQQFLKVFFSNTSSDVVLKQLFTLLLAWRFLEVCGGFVSDKDLAQRNLPFRS